MPLLAEGKFSHLHALALVYALIPCPYICSQGLIPLLGAVGDDLIVKVLFRGASRKNALFAENEKFRYLKVF